MAASASEAAKGQPNSLSATAMGSSIAVLQRLGSNWLAELQSDSTVMSLSARRPHEKFEEARRLYRGLHFVRSMEGRGISKVYFIPLSNRPPNEDNEAAEREGGAQRNGRMEDSSMSDSPLVHDEEHDNEEEETSRVDAQGRPLECYCPVAFGLGCEGPPGFAHGGSLAALLDDLMGALVGSTERIVRTRNIEVQYRRPVPMETPLRATARIVRVDGRNIHVTSTLTREPEAGVDGKSKPPLLLASASAVFAMVKLKNFGRKDSGGKASLPTNPDPGEANNHAVVRPDNTNATPRHVIPSRL